MHKHVLQRLNDAVAYYESKGYRYLDVPYAVDPRYVLMTTPKDSQIPTLAGKAIVGSAEQSFLELAHQNKINKDDKYCAITPCFRDEKEDEIHKLWFMKLELFSLNNSHFYSLILDAQMFLSRYVNCGIYKMPIPTYDATHGSKVVESYDIVDYSTKIELGSYMSRCNPDIGNWICGTGIAEPRLSICEMKNDAIFIESNEEING